MERPVVALDNAPILFPLFPLSLATTKKGSSHGAKSERRDSVSLEESEREGGRGGREAESYLVTIESVGKVKDGLSRALATKTRLCDLAVCARRQASRRQNVQVSPCQKSCLCLFLGPSSSFVASWPVVYRSFFIQRLASLWMGAWMIGGWLVTWYSPGT